MPLASADAPTPSSAPSRLPACPYCRGPRGPGLFCTTCNRFNRYPNSPIVAASRLRRFGGYILELTLLLATLGIGWLIWLAVVAPRAQTPAKSFLGMHIVGEDGAPVSAGKVWVREILVKSIFCGLVPLANALWIFIDRDRQTLHDKIVETVIVYAPHGLDTTAPSSSSSPSVLQEELDALAQARDRGAITVYEYEARRQRLLGRR